MFLKLLSKGHAQNRIEWEALRDQRGARCTPLLPARLSSEGLPDCSLWPSLCLAGNTLEPMVSTFRQSYFSPNSVCHTQAPPHPSLLASSMASGHIQLSEDWRELNLCSVPSALRIGRMAATLEAEGSSG